LEQCLVQVLEIVGTVGSIRSLWSRLVVRVVHCRYGGGRFVMRVVHCRQGGGRLVMRVFHCSEVVC
jgi:hypothetical protein